MIEQIFPGLNKNNYSIESPATIKYNCIAWAAGSDEKWWWPSPNYYWPANLPLKEDVQTFELLFKSLGYSVCATGDIEEGFVKVAVYADGNSVKHAARQMPSGKWTSKLGPKQDIEHSLTALQGIEYGNVALILRRPIDAPQ